VISRTLELGNSSIIFDKTVLGNFAQAQVMHVLRRLYSGGAFICKAFRREVQAAIASGWSYPYIQSWLRLQAVEQALEDGWLRLADEVIDERDDVVELRLALEYNQRLGMVEAESIATARTRRWVFASDERRARSFARQQGVCVTGTWGVLVRATEQGILNINEADAMHTCLVDRGYRSPLTYENGISTFILLQSR